MAHHIGVPIVPMSICGSFEFNRKGSWMLYPSTINVYLHDTIETTGVKKEELNELMKEVHRIVAEPVDESLKIQPECPSIKQREHDKDTTKFETSRPQAG